MAQQQHINYKVDYTLKTDSKEELLGYFAYRNMGWITGLCTPKDHQDPGNLVSIRPGTNALFLRVYCGWCGSFTRKINL